MHNILNLFNYYNNNDSDVLACDNVLLSS